MKKLKIHTLCVNCGGLLLLAATAGCEKPHRSASFERLELTARYFKSVEQKNSATAVRQAEMLLRQEPGAEYLRRLISIQQSNDAIAAAQKQLNSGNIDAALKELRKALRLYPENPELKESLRLLSKAAQAQRVLAKMQRADRRNAAELQTALDGARNALKDVATPAMLKFFGEYDLFIQRVKAQEQEATLERERTVQQAALQIQIDEEKRRTEDAEFERAIRQMSSEGERVSREAGVPAEVK